MFWIASVIGYFGSLLVDMVMYCQKTRGKAVEDLAKAFSLDAAGFHLGLKILGLDLEPTAAQHLFTQPSYTAHHPSSE